VLRRFVRLRRAARSPARLGLFGSAGRARMGKQSLEDNEPGLRAVCAA